MSKLKLAIFVFLCFFFATCRDENADVTLSLSELETKSIGRKGAVLINTRVYPFSQFDKDPTRKTIFSSRIYNAMNSYLVDCGLWNPSQSNLYVFCNIDTNVPSGIYYIDFSVSGKFNYQNYNITLQPKLLNFEKLDKDIIDLYSEEQKIEIEDLKDSYELKFNVVSYNQELLMIRILGYIFLDCRQNNNELICQVKKSDLEKGLVSNDTYTNVEYINDADDIRSLRLPFVGRIHIIDYLTQKTDVFVGITKLIENITEGESYLTYETNITNINKVITSADNLRLNFTNEYNDTDRTYCFFKKNDDYPLFIICFHPSDLGKCWLKEINEEIVINNTNIRYNFRIQPTKNQERIYNSKGDKGTFIYDIYPEILDFTKNDSLYMYYHAKFSSNLKGITFNKDNEDLSCEKRKNNFVRCNVTKNHFDGKKSGYYFTKHTNHLGGKSTYYESAPVKVILKESFYSISLYYSLLLILVIF